jgi:hypothetical protein
VLRSFLGIVVACYIAIAEEDVRKAVLQTLVRALMRLSLTLSYNCIQLIVYLRLMCLVAIPCKVAPAIYAVRIAFHALVVKRTVTVLGRQCPWVVVEAREHAALLR